MCSLERMFDRLGKRPSSQHETEGVFEFMATQSSNSTGKSQPKKTAAKPSVAEKRQVQTLAEAAVDLPVGAALSVGDRVSDLIGPWAGRGGAEKQLKSYRTRVRKSLKRTERRGATARRRATTEARKTRNRVEREARRRQRSVESTLKSRRAEVEEQVKRAIDAPASRAQDLVDQVTDQLAALR